MISYVEHLKPFKLCFESAAETDTEMVLIPRIDPGQLLENILIVMYLRNQGEINRYGLWFYALENNRVRLELHLFKPAQRVYAGLEFIDGRELFPVREMERLNIFEFDFLETPFLLKIREDLQREHKLPLLFDKIL